MFAPSTSGFQLWRDLVKVGDDFCAHVKFVVFLAGVKFVIGNGESVHFWLDWWYGYSPLCSSFLFLFSYCSNPRISISKYSHNNWDLGLQCVLSPEELVDWHRLAAIFPLLLESAGTVRLPHSFFG